MLLECGHEATQGYKVKGGFACLACVQKGTPLKKKNILRAAEAWKKLRQQRKK